MDLTKTLCEMTQKGKMTEEDVTIDLIDAELESMLKMRFDGRYIELWILANTFLVSLLCSPYHP